MAPLTGGDMRFWAWLGARLLVGVVLIGWVISFLSPGGGEKEFQRAIEARKEVKSVRYSMVGDPTPTRHTEAQGELSCSENAYHNLFHMVDQDSHSVPDVSQEVVQVGAVAYSRFQNGPWTRGGYGDAAPNICALMSQGLDASVLPDLDKMMKHGIIEKGDKKTVGGVRCREWKVTVRGVWGGFDHRTICLGVDDHLPREMTTDSEKTHWIYSDFNAPLAIELPTPSVQQTGGN
jgi:hypothetical protein